MDDDFEFVEEDEGKNEQNEIKEEEKKETSNQKEDDNDFDFVEENDAVNKNEEKKEEVKKEEPPKVEDDDGFDFVEEEDTKKEDDIKEANEIKENDNNNLVNLEGDNNNDEIKTNNEKIDVIDNSMPNTNNNLLDLELDEKTKSEEIKKLFQSYSTLHPDEPVLFDGIITEGDHNILFILKESNIGENIKKSDIDYAFWFKEVYKTKKALPVQRESLKEQREFLHNSRN